MKYRIHNHAVDRYRERIEDCSDASWRVRRAARDGVVLTARQLKEARTLPMSKSASFLYYQPDRCLLVIRKGTKGWDVVTVLKFPSDGELKVREGMLKRRRRQRRRELVESTPTKGESEHG